MHILPQKISTKKWPKNDLKLPKIVQKWPKLPKLAQKCICNFLHLWEEGIFVADNDGREIRGTLRGTRGPRNIAEYYVMLCDTKEFKMWYSETFSSEAKVFYSCKDQRASMNIVIICNFVCSEAWTSPEINLFNQMFIMDKRLSLCVV